MSDAWKIMKRWCSRCSIVAFQQLLPLSSYCEFMAQKPLQRLLVTLKLLILCCKNINSHPLVALSFGKTSWNLPWSLAPNRVITIVTFTLNIFMSLWSIYMYFSRRHGSKITSADSVLHTVLSCHIFVVRLVADPEGIQHCPVPVELYPRGGVAVG